MRFEATYCGTLVVDPEDLSESTTSEQVIEEAIDRISDELITLAFVDPIISGSIETGEIEVIVTYDAETPAAALTAIDSGVRAAFHAAEVRTSEWHHVVSNGGVVFKQLTTADDDDDLLVDA